MSTLSQITQRIVAKRAERGFVTDPLKIYTLLTEEVGEIASELKRTWSANYDAFNRAHLADEIADVFVMLVALADQFEIDIEQAVEKKFFGKDAERSWKSARPENTPRE